MANTKELLTKMELLKQGLELNNKQIDASIVNEAINYISNLVEAPVSPKVADILYVVEMEGKDGVNIGRENLLEHLKFMTDNFNKYVGKAELFKYQKLEKIQ